MACSKVGEPGALSFIGWKLVSNKYASQEECDQDCNSDAGACTGANGVCRIVTACLCGQAEVFAGPGTTCNPLP